MPSLSSLLGSVFGTTQSKAAANAASATQTGINNAYNNAQPLINNAFATANNTLGQQYLTAGSTLAGGYNQGSNLVSTAGTRARGDLTGTYDSALSSLTDLYGRAQTGLADARGRITGYLSPYMSAGTGAQNLYNTYLGIGPGGAAAARAAGQNYAANDPGLEITNAGIARQSAALANAGGYLGSGREAMARDRAVAERTSQEYQAYLSRLERQAGLGQQAATTAGGFDTTLSGLSAGLLGQQGNQTSALTAQHGRDLAANETSTARTLADLLQTYTGRLSANDMAYGQSAANNAISQGRTLAELIASRDTGLAAADAQRILGQSAAASQGMNNIIDIGKAVAQMAMGMPPTAATGIKAGTTPTDSGQKSPMTASPSGPYTAASPPGSPSFDWARFGDWLRS